MMVLGETQLLRILSLEIAFPGYAFPDSDADWDGNWLDVRVRYKDEFCQIGFEQTCLRTKDVADFRDQLKQLHTELKGAAVLASAYEPAVRIRIEAIDSTGHLSMAVDLTPGSVPGEQRHHLELGLDQSYLPLIIEQLNAIAIRLPER